MVPLSFHPQGLCARGRGRRLMARRWFLHVVLLGLVSGLLTAPVALGAAPPQSGPIDYQTTIAMGINAQGNTVRAPFNIPAPGPGVGRLNFVEFRSENGLPFNISVFARADYNEFCATANEGKALVAGDRVTQFLLDFNNNPRVETQPPANHTEAFDYVQRFARLPADARDTAYMIVVERKELEASFVNVTIDRISSAGPLPGDFGAASVGALAATAAVAMAVRRRRRP